MFSQTEIDDLKDVVIRKGQVLKNNGLTNTELGPAIAGVYDQKTGKVYTAINDVNGNIPEQLHPLIEERILNMPQDVIDSYTFTKGAGSHAEVLALNQALLANPGANVDDFLVYVNRTLGTSKPVTEIPFHTCPHCNYILEGFNILSDIE